MKNKIPLVIVVIIGYILIDTFVIDQYFNKNVENAQIEKVLEEQCECSLVVNEIHGTGISFQDKVYGDYHNFRLSDCKFINFEESVLDLNRKLETTIPNFEEADLVKLSFQISPTEVRIVSIRNSILSFE